MKIIVVLIFLINFGFSSTLDTKNGEYCLNDSSYSIHRAYFKDEYFDLIGVPDIYVSTKCYENCKKNCCYNILVNENGKTLRSYSTNDSVVAITRNRYKNKAYLAFSHTYGSGKDTKIDYHLIDNHLKEYKFNSVGGKVSAISLDAKFVEVNRYGVYKDAKLLHKNNIEFESLNITNNLKGDMAVAGIEKDTRAVYISNLDKWLNTNIVLSTHSDQNGILSIYPENHNNIYLTVYNIINIYNKGLMGAYIDFNKDKSYSGWVYNYEKENIGFDPEIYLYNNKVIINARNSSSDKTISFQIDKEKYKQIDKKCPNRDGFEDEFMASFMIGGGFEYLFWDANSKAKIDDTSYASSEYDISDSVYKKIYLQGRVSDTQLAISYMKSEAKKAGGLTKKASDVLNVLIDFNALVSKSSTLRLSYTSSKINGLTTFIDEHNGAISLDRDGEIKEFESKIDRISLLLMKERGFYWGLEYTKFETPSVLGFSGSSKDMEYYGLDDKFGITDIEILIGYDTAAYAKRYETDFRKFYFQGLFGGGVSIYDISGEFKKQVETTSQKSIVDSSFSFVFDLELQLGYLWQQRFKAIKGFGYSLDMGLKARGSYTLSGQSEDSDKTIEVDELQLEMDRYDIWYGPYIYFNILF